MAKHATEKKSGKGKIIGIVVVVLLIFGLIGSCGSEDTQSGSSQPSNQQNEAVEQSEGVDFELLQGIIGNASGIDASSYTEDSYAALVAAIDAGEAVLEDESATQEQVDDAQAAITNAISALVESNPLTLGQQNAIESAISYLNVLHFSRQGLIDQLMFEGFTADEAEFAVDYLNVDWNEQAAGKAQDYLDTLSFSRQGLIDQLLFEGFSQEQAEYGVTAVGY